MSEPPPRDVPRPAAAAEEQAAASGLRLGGRRAATLPSSPHSERFRLALSVLFVLGLGAVAMAVIAAQGTRTTTTPWSSFKPQFAGEAGARQIANYISPNYRIGPGQRQQLAVINLSSTLNGSTVVLKEGPSANDIAIPGGNTLIYQFCGLGPSCSIPGNPASQTPFELARLEAFELALYSLHYLHSVDNVVSLLPPAVDPVAAYSSGALWTTPPAALGNKAKAVIALETSRDQVTPLLNQPVSTLFPNSGTRLVTPRAIAAMDIITSGELFTPSSETGSDGTSYLVLSQLAAQ